MCLCLGPSKSGKTLLLKCLQGDEIDDATHTVQTNGINLFTVKNDTGEFDMIIREIGGNMAPIWKHYFDKVIVNEIANISMLFIHTYICVYIYYHVLFIV